MKLQDLIKELTIKHSQKDRFGRIKTLGDDIGLKIITHNQYEIYFEDCGFIDTKYSLDYLGQFEVLSNIYDMNYWNGYTLKDKTGYTIMIDFTIIPKMVRS